MKKILKSLLCIIIVLSLSACSFPVSEQKTEYRAAYEETLKKTGAALSEEEIRDEENEGTPWIATRISLPGLELCISADALQEHLYAYNMYHSYILEDYKPLDLTVQDVVNLYKKPNAEKQAAFEELAEWYSGCESTWPYGYTITSWYVGFAVRSRRQYKEMYGKPFVDKKNALYTADDIYALVQWGLEHIDYGFCKDVYENYDNPEYDDIDTDYVNFLSSIGLFGDYDYVGDQQLFYDFWK